MSYTIARIRWKANDGQMHVIGVLIPQGTAPIPETRLFIRTPSGRGQLNLYMETLYSGELAVYSDRGRRYPEDRTQDNSPLGELVRPNAAVYSRIWTRVPDSATGVRAELDVCYEFANVRSAYDALQEVNSQNPLNVRIHTQQEINTMPNAGATVQPITVRITFVNRRPLQFLLGMDRWYRLQGDDRMFRVRYHRQQDGSNLPAVEWAELTDTYPYTLLSAINYQDSSSCDVSSVVRRDISGLDHLLCTFWPLGDLDGKFYLKLELEGKEPACLVLDKPARYRLNSSLIFVVTGSGTMNWEANTSASVPELFKQPLVQVKDMRAGVPVKAVRSNMAQGGSVQRALDPILERILKPSEEMLRSLAKMREFAQAPLTKALSMVHCGFELETQAVNGLSYSRFEEERSGSGEIDFERIDAAITDLLNGLRWNEDTLRMEASSSIVDSVRAATFTFNRDELFNKLARCAAQVVTVAMVREYANRVSIPSRASLLQFLDYMNAVSELDETRRGTIANLLFVALKGREVRRWLRDVAFSHSHYATRSTGSVHVPDTVDAKPDGSVRGPEFATRGPLKAVQFRKALAELTGRNRLTVDERCSFHIHLSIPGIRHKYGKRLQSWIYEALLQQTKRYHKGLTLRLQNSDWRQQYFPFNKNSGKYDAVAFRKEHGTWEFRLFGNVTTEQEGWECLRMAVEALQYAYRIKFRMQKPEKDALDMLHESELDIGAIIKGDLTLKQAVRDKRKQLLKAEDSAA